MSRLEWCLWGLDFVIGGVGFVFGGPYAALLCFFVAGLLIFIGFTKKDESEGKSQPSSLIVDYANRPYRSSPSIKKWHRWGLGASIAAITILMGYGVVRYVVKTKHAQPDSPGEQQDTASATSAYIRKTDPFYTYVLFNTNASKHPITCANSMMPLRIGACGEIRDIINRNFRSDTESVAYLCAEVLQHYMIALLQMDEMSGSDGSQAHKFNMKPGRVTNVPDKRIYSVNELLTTLSDEDRNMFPWNFHGDSTVTLPQGTRISFEHILPGPSPVAYKATLYRTGCFRVGLSVTPTAPHAQGDLPDGYELGTVPDATSRIVTYPFLIQAEYKIERKTKESCNKDDYEQWVKDVFAGIKMRIEN
jgi:hypothetical protein